MKYLCLDKGSIGFKDSEINTILETDTAIPEAAYNKYFELKDQGKQFKVINIYGETFEDIFAEVPPTTIVDANPSQEDRIKLLEQAMDEMLLGGAL